MVLVLVILIWKNFLVMKKMLIWKNYIGVYSSNNLTIYINVCNVIKERNAKYQFATFNTDRNNKAGLHWIFRYSYCILRYSSKKKKLFLFYSLGFTGFKEFIIDNDLNIIDKLLNNVNKFNKNDEKINLINLKFSEYDRIKRKEVLSKLTNTAKDLFHLLREFSNNHNVKEMTLYAVDDQLQETTSDT